MGSLKMIAACVLVAALGSQVFAVIACTPCRPPWVNFRSHCYLVWSEPKTFDEAEAHCQGLTVHGRPSHLASIRSQEEQDFVSDLIAATVDQGQFIWFGYRRVDNTPRAFAWVDGCRLGDYTNWERGEPNDTNEKCSILYDTGKWNDFFCSRNCVFVCKTPDRMSQTNCDGQK
ncbi:snaclec 3-like [Acanthaster planci]|uniref:Snaclec 3-like n=1 Tax=Acanthaster planci TaxID=133434 RepID=A0A8B7YT62_ACAPL|nr:snaclec 3-like [Acanthaster planci]